MAAHSIRCLSCFSGVGALDLGFKIAFPAARTVCYVEIGIEAAEVLASRIEEGSLDDAPVWSDMRTFDGAAWRGSVDCILAGFPCPDYSFAGKRAGIVGKHGQLWDELARVIRDVEPGAVLLENVPGILAPHGTAEKEWVLPAGLWHVLGDLAALGFDAEWCCVRAADVGASHGRNRWFCLAYRKELAYTSRDERGGSHGETGERRGVRETGDELVAYRSGTRHPWHENARADRRDEGEGTRGSEFERRCRELGNPDRPGLEGRDKRRGGCADERLARQAGNPVESLFAPGPDSLLWQNVLVRDYLLRPALSQAETQPAVHELADGLATILDGSRTDSLRAAGNGCVPLQVAVAARVLARRAGLTTNV